MSTEVTDNPAEQRYEISVDGAPAGFTEYEPGEGVVMFMHTEVDPAFKGQGVGGALARGALDDVRAKGRGVVALCPFIKSWIEKHPDYQDMLAR